MNNYFTPSSPLRKSLGDDSNRSFDFYAFFARKQNLSIFTCVFLVAFISVFVSIIFTQYKANPCSPFARVMIEKSVFNGQAHAYLANLTRKVYMGLADWRFLTDMIYFAVGSFVFSGCLR
jgi:hypothetical protein